MIDKVDASRDMVDIHEEIISPETLGKSIVKPTGRADRIVSAVIDKNLSRYRLPECPLKHSIAFESSLFKIHHSRPARTIHRCPILNPQPFANAVCCGA